MNVGPPSPMLKRTGTRSSSLDIQREQLSPTVSYVTVAPAQREAGVTVRSSSPTVQEPDPTMKSWHAKAANTPLHTQKRYVAIGAGLLAFMIFLVFMASSPSAAASLAHLRLDKFPETFRIGVIADLDQSSKKEDANVWTSLYMTGTLKRTGDKYSVAWDPPVELTTSHNEAGRGCELSELIRYEGRLYSFDDRTGIMFELKNGESTAAAAVAAATPALVPRAIFMEGDGASSDKGMKVEWATVKDGVLVVGSFGKEYTNKQGAVLHSNNQWVTLVHKDESVSHVDWRGYYTAMRAATGTEAPGYMIHEAVAWSPHHRKWYVFPRRVSSEAYDDVADEKRGHNTVLVAAHDFAEIHKATVGTRTPERGFSSVKFLPGSRDSVVLALKSEENAEAGTQRTFLAVYQEDQASGTWKTLLEETPLPIDKKFEGVEVLSAQ